MFAIRRLPVIALMALLSLSSEIGAQEEYGTALVPNCRTTFTYLWPTEPRQYECCARSEPAEIFAQEDDQATTKKGETASIIKFRADEAMRLDAPQASCVDLSELTPLERILRDARKTFGSCTRFVVYDHFPCTCENSCNDVNDFFCTCPGVPPGELPEIKPQDSLGSQPELISETLTPCGRLSSCNGAPDDGEIPAVD